MLKIEYYLIILLLTIVVKRYQSHQHYKKESSYLHLSLHIKPSLFVWVEIDSFDVTSIYYERSCLFFVQKTIECLTGHIEVGLNIFVYLTTYFMLYIFTILFFFHMFQNPKIDTFRKQKQQLITTIHFLQFCSFSKAN